MANKIATTILEQIGGKALHMIGARNTAWAEKDGVGFKVMKNAKGVKALKITLDETDTYTVTAYGQRSLTKGGDAGVFVVSELKDIYCDQLHTAIKALTGLNTSL